MKTALIHPRAVCMASIASAVAVIAICGCGGPKICKSCIPPGCKVVVDKDGRQHYERIKGN